MEFVICSRHISFACMCKTITKAGIHAQVVDEDNNIPVTIFVARDHHHMEPKFSEVKEWSLVLVHENFSYRF